MSKNNKTLMTLPGDGIGPEVMAATMKIIDWMAKNRSIAFDIKEGLVGGAAYDAKGEPLTDETLADSMAADATLFGAVGGPQYDDLPFEKKPERGLLRLRKEMELFANLRPAMVFPSLVSASTLKPEVVSGLNIMIVRELTGGVYFAEPRGRKTMKDGTISAFDTNLYNEKEIERIGRAAFDLARKRSGNVVSAEKANVMHSGVLWREVMQRLHKNEGDGIALSHMYADNCAMQLVRAPKQFDVIVTDNLFGDILSDTAAMLTGSLGMLPSASLGAADETGRRLALYEPVHGSAPDIAGQNKANPLAQLLSFSMLLRYSLDQGDEADLIESAVEKALEGELRTLDIMTSGCTPTSTDGMIEQVIRQLDELTR